MSNLQGTNVVASMVVFEDGLPRKSEYRRFSIKGHDGTDDISSIYEVITRRFRRYLDEREETGELDVLGDPDASEPGEGPGGGQRTELTEADGTRPCGSASSPTRPTCSSWTAARARPTRPGGP